MTDDRLSFEDLPQPAFEGRVAPDELAVDGENPNEMTDEQFGLLCERLRQNGWLGGPIVTDTDGLIADGEHRWRAAKEIGLAEVPVRQYDIDDATRRLWRQELNKIHGEHDAKRDALEYDLLLDSGLSDEVHDIVEAAEEDLDELLAEIKMETSRPAEYDYDPDHNVYFEDCVEGMRERLEDDSVDMVFTSPPYNVEKTQRSDEQVSVEVVEYSDDKTDEEFRTFLQEVFEECSRVVRPGGHIFINIGLDIKNGTVREPTWLRKLIPIPLRSLIVWSKSSHANLDANNQGRYYHDYEVVLHFSEDPDSLNGTDNFAVWDIVKVSGRERQESKPHPAPFPTELPKRAIETTTGMGDTVLDPFMGSGTTAVAAIESGRSYVGFELDEEGAYKPIIERRIGEAKRQRSASVNAEGADD